MKNDLTCEGGWDDTRIQRIEQDNFSKLKSLTTLYLNDNNLSRLDENLFINLDQLNNISLAKNNLSVIPKTLFLSLKRLERIDLTNNRLTQILGSGDVKLCNDSNFCKNLQAKSEQCGSAKKPLELIIRNEKMGV